MMNYIDGPEADPGYSQDEVMVIDWVNSLDLPSCTLADDIHDLKSGCVVADIVSWLFSITLPGIQRDISCRADAIANWAILLSHLASYLPRPFLGRPEEFLDNSEKLLGLLNYLSNVKKEPEKNKPTPRPKPVESPIPLRENLTVFKKIPAKVPLDLPEKIPEQVKYEPKPVPESLKEGLVEWLESLQILRKDAVTVNLIPNICRTGVLLCDVVNRVEGRVEVIKGVERKPKNKTQALTNINKALEYLRGLSKINSKHLWAAKEIVEGDENVIWGLLDDMKALFAPVPVKPKPIPVMSKPPPSIAIPVSASYGKISIPKAVVKDDKSKRSYSASMKKFSSKLSSVSTSRVSRPPSSRSIQSESARPERFSISPEMKKNMFNWVEALGIEYEPNTNPYLDILKNGVLLCDLMRVLENVNIKTNLKPRTIQAVHENFNNAIGVCISKRVEIPHLLLRTSEHLSQNSEVLHGVLYYLMAAYPYAGPAEYQPCVLQYGAVNIRNLEKTIVNWIDELQILQPSPCAFAELISELKKGTLLCVVTSKVTGIRISNVIPDPKTEQTALNNIRKSLEVLRKLPKMSQKFTYNEKEIYKGNFNILLGLLEDILRWTDGVPARKSGDPYKDGPYLRESLKKPAKISEETFNTTFGSMHSPKLGERSEILIEGPDQYIQWLYSIGAQFPRSINFSDEHIPEFTTGVLICNITEALEKIRIPGIDKEPRTRASALQNINKALFILKKKKGFPKELQQCADEIFLGNGELIRNLISELMRIYKA